MTFRSLADDDIFISYTHLDASTYAAGLADELTKKGFSCFIDRLGTEPGKDLPSSLRRKIRGCAMLIVVATERAGERQTIEEEIREFLRAGRHTSVVVIDFGGALYRARWYGLVEGIAPEQEKSATALDDGNPSPSVISRVEKQFNYRRRNQRLRRVTLGMAVLLALLTTASVAAAVFAKRQIKSAAEATERAEQARAEASAQRRSAELYRAEASAAQGEAARAKAAASEQARRAALSAKEAEKQTGLATSAARRAEMATADAERQEGLAAARKAAATADARRAESLQSADDWVGPLVSGALLSVEAAKRLTRSGVAPAESDQSLRASLNLLPRSVRSFKRKVEDVLVSADGKYFITKEGDFVRVWDTANLKQVSDDIKLGGGDPTFNRNRTLMALTGKDRQVSVWELPSGKRRWSMGRVDAFSSNADETPALVFSPDGNYVAAGVSTGAGGGAEPGRLIVVWDAKTGERVAEVGYSGRLYGIALSPGDDRLALSVDTPRRRAADAGPNNSIIQFWTVKKPATFLFEAENSDNDGPLHALSFSPNGKLLAVAGNNRASVLEVGGGREFTPIEGIKDFDHGDSPFIYKLSFSPDGKSLGAMRRGFDVDTWDVLLGKQLWRGMYLNEGWSYERPYVIVREAGGIRVVDVTTGRDVARVLRDDSHPYGADYAPEADLLAVNFDDRVLLYDVGSAQESARVTYGDGGKFTYRSPDQRYVVLNDRSRSLLLSAQNPGRAVQLEHGDDASDFALNPGGTLLAFFTPADGVRIVETGGGREVSRIAGVPRPKRGRPEWPRYTTLGFSPRSGFIYTETADDPAVRVYSLRTGREVLRSRIGTRAHLLYETYVSFTPNDKYVLVRDAGTDRVFDTTSGEPVAALPVAKGAGELVLGTDGVHMARSLQDSIEVLEIAGGKLAYNVKLVGGVADFAFSQDGKLIAAVGRGVGRICDAATGGLAATFALDKNVNFVQFSRDGRFLKLFDRDIDRSPPSLVALLDVATRRVISLPHPADYVLFSPNGRHALVSDNASFASLIDLATGRVAAKFPYGGTLPDDATFSPDGSLLATVSEGRTVHVWDTAGSVEIARLPHEDSIVSMAFEPGGRRLTTIGDDRKARTWILPEEELIKRACARLNGSLGRDDWEESFGVEKYSDTCAPRQASRGWPQANIP